jgi:hypothetical protein
MDCDWFWFDKDPSTRDCFEGYVFESIQDQKLANIEASFLPQNPESIALSSPAIDPNPPPPQSQDPGQPHPRLRRPRAVFPVEGHREMAQWLMENIDFPFATKEIENRFIAKYGMTRKQFRTAFNNRRQRLVPSFRLKRQLQSKESSAGPFFPLSLEDDGNCVHAFSDEK